MVDKAKGKGKGASKEKKVGGKREEKKAKAETKKVTPKKEKKAKKKEKPTKPKAKSTRKSREEKEKIKKIALKKRKKIPTIRGRFGKKQTRRISNKKWQKWRKPRGIDIHRRKEFGAWPKTGYGAVREVKGLHPSGNVELLVNRPEDLKLATKEIVVRIASTVGSRKRKQIVMGAKKLGLRLLNR